MDEKEIAKKLVEDWGDSVIDDFFSKTYKFEKREPEIGEYCVFEVNKKSYMGHRMSQNFYQSQSLRVRTDEGYPVMTMVTVNDECT